MSAPSGRRNREPVQDPGRPAGACPPALGGEPARPGGPGGGQGSGRRDRPRFWTLGFPGPRRWPSLAWGQRSVPHQHRSLRGRPGSPLQAGASQAEPEAAPRKSHRATKDLLVPAQHCPRLRTRPLTCDPAVWEVERDSGTPGAAVAKWHSPTETPSDGTSKPNTSVT